MKLTIEYEQEDDLRWLAEISELPGVLAYGSTPDEAIGHVKVLALYAVADQIEQDELPSSLTEISFAMA